MDRILEKALDVDTITVEEELSKRSMASLRNLLFNGPLPPEEVIRREYHEVIEKAHRDLAAASPVAALCRR